VGRSSGPPHLVGALVRQARYGGTVSVEAAVRKIPRCPQLLDHDRWAEHGFDSREDSELWSDRACGVACIAMVLEYADGTPRAIVNLLHEGRRRGAYSSNGWVHTGLAELLRAHGTPAEARAVTSLGELARLVQSYGPVIASVTLHFPEDGRRGGHLVLVTGAEWHCREVTKIFFNDPSRWGAHHGHVSAARFAASFTGRIVSTEVRRPVGEVE